MPTGHGRPKIEHGHLYYEHASTPINMTVTTAGTEVSIKNDGSEVLTAGAYEGTTLSAANGTITVADGGDWLARCAMDPIGENNAVAQFGFGIGGTFSSAGKRTHTYGATAAREQIALEAILPGLAAGAAVSVMVDSGTNADTLNVLNFSFTMTKLSD